MDDTTGIRLTRGDVEDVTRVVFAKAGRSRCRFDPDRSLPTWLVNIAQKRAADHRHEHALRDRVTA
ncbi:sigma factor [Microtetraspora malaysiensis]|uniref:sigma factor n=1 Tax=Microtetraspora malaysiensis TaxID=161358 RepID=UPI003D8BF0FC